MNKLDAALRSAQEVLALRKNIGDVIAKTRADLHTLEQQMTEARHELQREEADSALGRLAPGKAGSASANLRKLREKAELLQARVAGLERSLLETDDKVLDAETAFAGQLSEHGRLRMEEFHHEYTRAAEIFAQTLRRGKALSDGLDIPFPGLDKVQLFDPYNPQREIASAMDSKVIPGHGLIMVPVRSAADEKLYQELSAMMILRTTLRKEVHSIRQARNKARQAAQVTALKKSIDSGKLGTD